MTQDEIIRAIDALCRLYRNFTDTSKTKEADEVSEKLLILVGKLE